MIGAGLAVLVAASAAYAVLGRDDGKEEPPCERFCVEASSHPSFEGVTVYRGRSWLPDRPLKATFAPSCDGDEFCSDVGEAVRLRTDARGAFTFLFRDGARRPDDAGRRVHAGDGSPGFEQWQGRPYRSKLVRRKAPD